MGARPNQRNSREENKLVREGGMPADWKPAKRRQKDTNATWTQKHGYHNHIQRKGRRNKPLSECQQRRNHRIAKTRARVEHVFASIEQMGGKLIRTIGKTRASFALTTMVACYNLKRLVYFRKAGVEAF